MASRPLRADAERNVARLERGGAQRVFQQAAAGAQMRGARLAFRP